MTQPMKFMLAIEEFIKGTQKDLKIEVDDMIYYGDIEINERNLDRLNKIIQAYEAWTNFVDNSA
jgi:hypothetical protein